MLRALNALLSKTDHKRWADTSNIHVSWEPRSQLAASLVPDNSHVIEFGAGKRVLERYLDPSCTYTPSDMVDRGPGTIICDLNIRPLPDLGSGTYDVAVLLGVLEYLRDVPSFLDWLAKLVPVCVLGCAPATATGYSPRALRETARRLKAGWMNNYQEEELLALFRDRGFAMVRDENWQYQRLFVFSQHPIT
jgi:Methyltransferase domain